MGLKTRSFQHFGGGGVMSLKMSKDFNPSKDIKTGSETEA